MESKSAFQQDSPENSFEKQPVGLSRMKAKQTNEFVC